MAISNILLGFITGFPIMIVVGPIALLLIDQGLERGLRGGYPAALGVAGADLLYASLSAVAGVAAARFLAPISAWLNAAAVLMLVALAVRLGRSALAELRAPVVARAGALVPAGAVPPGAIAGNAVGTAAGSAGASAVGSAVGTAAGNAEERAVARLADAASGRGRLALAGGFFGITAINPITIVVFATLVVGGAGGAGTAGWVLGMVLASLTINFGFLAIGHGLGAVLDTAALARVRLAAAGLIVALALHFALG